MSKIKWKCTKLDARYNYKKYFGFMLEVQGIGNSALKAVEFNRVKKWFEQTYGYSAEVKDWVNIVGYFNFTQAAKTLWRKKLPANQEEIPLDIISEHWSWSTGRDGEDHRIYCATDKEVAFFQLAQKIDQ